MSKKLTYQHIRDCIKSAPNYSLVSTEYKNAHTKLEMWCGNKDHKPFWMTWNNFHYGKQKCPYCAGKIITYKQVKKYIESAPDYELLSKEYKNAYTKLKIHCGNKDHKPFWMKWNNFQQGQRCPHCAGKIITYHQVKKHIESVPNYKLLSKEYKNAHTKMEVRCGNKRHFPYKVTWANFKKGHRCPVCKESKGEKEITRILTDFDIFYTSQYKLSKTRLKLDFYVPSFNLGIEYDGQQHFSPIVGAFGAKTLEKAQQNFKKQQRNDQKKDDLCKRLGIALLRIGYADNIRQKIERHLESLSL